MELSMQLHLSGLSLSNTGRVREIFGVLQARSTVHARGHKADLQSNSVKSPDHVAGDGTVLQLNGQR